MNDFAHTSPAYIISADLNGKRWAHAMVMDDGTEERLEMAKRIARNYRESKTRFGQSSFKNVRLSRCRDQQTIDNAQFQIDKIADWESDFEVCE